MPFLSDADHSQTFCVFNADKNNPQFKRELIYNITYYSYIVCPIKLK